MKNFAAVILLFLCISINAFPQNSVKNKIAVTMDDMPMQAIDSYSGKELADVFNKIITAFKKENIPVIGFVNEDKLISDGKHSQSRIALLEKWLDAGLDLGNHTFAHKSANAVPVEVYKEDIVNGEPVLRELLSKRGKKLEYFRHPFLQTGLSLEVKKEINDFLSARGYTIAPVTFDNSEWIFAKAYKIAADKGDAAMAGKIGAEYISYMKRKLEYYEGRSTALFGRNISHTLLIHANKLNSEYLGELIKMLKEKHYEFVSLGEALKDDAYKSEDKFIRNAGISWIDRWALAMGKKKDFFAGEPVCPAEIMKYAGVDSE